MPYRINKLKNPCTQSDGDKGYWSLTYTDKKGKKHRNCHTSEKGARSQIAAIEGPKESDAAEDEDLLLDESIRSRSAVSNSRDIFTESIKYHAARNKPAILENEYRPGSWRYFQLIDEARALYEVGAYKPKKEEIAYLNSDLGTWGVFEGRVVPLDFPLSGERKNTLMPTDYILFCSKLVAESVAKDNELYLGGKSGKLYMPKVGSKLTETTKRKTSQYEYAVIVQPKNRPASNGTNGSTWDSIDTPILKLETVTVISATEAHKLLDGSLKKNLSESYIELEEAEYDGRDVDLNKPMRSSGPTKYQVYVRNPKTDKVIKVNFGDEKGGLSSKINDPEARKSFVARHNCEDKKDKTKAGYWSCRLPRYWKELGLKKTSHKWW